MNLTIARLAMSAATYSIDKPYDYIVPESMIDRAAPGMRVLAPFGKGNKKREGIILAMTRESAFINDKKHDSSQKALKCIETLLDDEPILTSDNIKLALWMSDRFFCTVFEALRAMLPAGIWSKDGTLRFPDKTVSIATLNISCDDADIAVKQKQLSAPRQAAVIQMLIATGSMPVRDICHFTGAAASAVKSLAKQGILYIEERGVYRRPGIHTHKPSDPITLSDEQRQVYSKISELSKSNRPEAALLYGVTGSGKTVIYVKLIEDALSRGRTAIVLVPEIALTPQTVSVFASFFGDSVAVLHSALAVGERYDEWKRIRSGAVRVVVGTRSAIFAPLANLGLIIIDEEQEHTYKSENSPRYHARDIAKYRVTRENALLLLSSATPSIESMYNASAGRYKLFRLEKRFNETGLPPVFIADMRRELQNGNAGSLSTALRGELEQNINRCEQSILFINRRGAYPLVACGQCGYTFRCSRCSVSMTYHSADKRLICHYCGFSVPVPGACPDCGGKLKFIGAGTQKVESELLECFPGIKIIRMDADTVSRTNSHARLLASFRDGNAQILLGTQMVTKGLDFENVTLVGVLSADMLLYMSDYRAHEKAFSLITQVVGRSGRGEKPGRAVIQTFTPGHEVITLASGQDYDRFYEREIAIRQALGSPPLNDLLALMASGTDEIAVQTVCQKLRSALEHHFRGIRGVKLLGPAPAPVVKVNNKFRYRLLVSCENTKRVREIIAHTIREFSRDKESRGVSFYADAELYD